MVSNRGIRGIVLLVPAVNAPGFSDGRGAAVGELWHTYTGIAGHCCESIGVFRGRLDDVFAKLP
jgi:hypothetical protein